MTKQEMLDKIKEQEKEIDYLCGKIKELESQPLKEQTLAQALEITGQANEFGVTGMWFPFYDRMNWTLKKFNDEFNLLEAKYNSLVTQTKGDSERLIRYEKVIDKLLDLSEECDR